MIDGSRLPGVIDRCEEEGKGDLFFCVLVPVGNRKLHSCIVQSPIAIRECKAFTGSFDNRSDASISPSFSGKHRACACTY